MKDKKRYFEIASLLVLLLSFVTFYLLIGLSIWIIPLIALWGIFVFLMFVYKKVPFNRSVIIFCFILVLSGGITYYAHSLLQGNDCESLYNRYNNKVITFSGDRIKGQIGVKIDKDTCEYTATIHSVFKSDKLVSNQVPETPTQYNYLADVVLKDDNGSSDGTINVAYQNIDQLPTDAFDISAPVLLYGYSGDFTGSFYHSYQIKGTVSESNIKELLGMKEMKIYDSTKGSSVVDNGSGYKYLRIDHEVVVRDQDPIEVIPITTVK